MLGDKDATANVAVRDLQVARHFYRDILGLKEVGDEAGELYVFQSGRSLLNVYRSQYAGTNKATAVTWDVGRGIEDAVEALRTKGVSFEHYDLPGLRLNGDVHEGHGMKVAWFRDPDGNILNIVGS